MQALNAHQAATVAMSPRGVADPAVHHNAFWNEPSGRATLDGSECLCGEDIQAGDIVVASFDRRQVSTGCGLYLVESPRGWHGCRRMMRVPSGIAIDQDGHGDWVTVATLDDTVWRVVGTVETVYRPTNYR